MRDVSRRDFLKISGAAFAASSVAGLIRPDLSFAAEASDAPPLRIRGATESTTICCYCSVGCGAICSVIDGTLINFEGDPDHPSNEGGMCSKGVAQFNVINVYDPETGAIKPNPARLTNPRYRAPGATEWKDVSWDWAIDEIAKRVKTLRDATFEEKNENGVTVNRTNAIASLGGAALDNEECHVLSKFARALGIVYLEHQARL
jgi:formate dehydrogenase major subunit